MDRRRVFYFNLNYHCNYDCRFCFSHNTNLHGECRELALADFERILLKNAVSQGDRIVLNGGEPALHLEFVSFVECAKKSGAETVVYSNGSCFNDGKILREFLCADPDRITIPIHGDRQLHDYITRTSGSYDLTLAGVKNFIERGRGDLVELKFIITNQLSKLNFSIRDFIDSVDPRQSIKRVVLAGQVNTSKAKRAHFLLVPDRCFVEYVEREILECQGKYETKFYDLPLCMFSEKFKGRLNVELYACAEEPVVFFADAKTPLKLVVFTPRRDRACLPCRLKGLCRSIQNTYCVAMMYRDKFYNVLE